jgi:hypothetical protein
MVNCTILFAVRFLSSAADFEWDSQFVFRNPAGHMEPSDRYFDIPDLDHNINPTSENTNLTN